MLQKAYLISLKTGVVENFIVIDDTYLPPEDYTIQVYSGEFHQCPIGENYADFIADPSNASSFISDGEII